MTKPSSYPRLLASGPGPLDEAQPDSRTPITYRSLLDFHRQLLSRSMADEGKSPEQIKHRISNHRTALNRWLQEAPWLEDTSGCAVSASLDDKIGDEMGARFEEYLSVHLAKLQKRSNSRQAVDDRKSRLKKIRESWITLVRSDGLPENFTEALRVLVKRTGGTVNGISRHAGVSRSALRNWYIMGEMPTLRSRDSIRALEAYFGVNAGALYSRIPRLYTQSMKALGSNRTPHRVHTSVTRNYPFRMRAESLNESQRREWLDLWKFYTDPAWAAAQGLKRDKRGWSKKRETSKNGTTDVKLANILQFYGYLTLPRLVDDAWLVEHGYDPEAARAEGFEPTWLEGAGLSPEELSLALFADVKEYVHGAISFFKGRTLGKVYNSHVKNFLTFCAQLLRPGYGFLWQHPEFGEQCPAFLKTYALPSRGDKKTRKAADRTRQEMRAQLWQEFCADGHSRINNIVIGIQGSRDDSFTQSRDTNDIVRSMIIEREHPITVMLDVADGFRRDFELACSERDKAHLFRGMLLFKLLSSNPVRSSNVAGMRYREGCRGLETDPCNLYRKEDGSWHLKYEVWELKNGAARGRYDLPINPDIWKDIEEYLQVWRPQLYGAAECDYVFRHAPRGIGHLPSDMREALKSKPMSTSQLSHVWRQAIQRYMPGAVGVGIHSARHFVATEYLKHDPGAYAIAATILHDSENMVRKTYSWVTPADKAVFWTRHLSYVLRQYRREAA